MVESPDTQPMESCGWPGCDRAAAHRIPIEPGMVVRIEGTTFEGDAFAVCKEHAPRMAKIALEAIDEALRRDAARRNYAPGDPEWNDLVGDR